MSALQIFQMPDVGEGIAEAEIIEWLVAVGDTVGEDQPIVVIETDKSQVELPSPFSGMVVELLGAAGDTVAVGRPLVTVTSDEAAEPDTETRLVPDRISLPSTQVATPLPASPASMSHRPLASPSTRRRAVSHGIDLDTVRGTGRGGRIQLSDIVEAVGQTGVSTVAPAADTEDASGATTARTSISRADNAIPVRGLRRQIARSMTQSLLIPHVTEFREVDATALMEAKNTLAPELAKDGIKLSVLPFLIKATIRALRLNPGFNATYDADREEITQYGGVHLGIATSTDDGLIVPVLRDADQLGIREITLGVARIADLARTRKAKPEELTGGGFTVTNFGSFGTWLGTPVIRHPEVAIAGFGRIRDQVIPVGGLPSVRPVLPIVVAADHRINDGADLGALVTAIAAAVAEPYLLLD